MKKYLEILLRSPLFRGITAEELERLLPKPVAAEVYEFFHKEDHSQCE